MFKPPPLTKVTFDDRVPHAPAVLAGKEGSPLLCRAVLDLVRPHLAHTFLGVEESAPHTLTVSAGSFGNRVVIATAHTVALRYQTSRRPCPRCEFRSQFLIIDPTVPKPNGVVVCGCRECGWRTTQPGTLLPEAV